MNSVLNSFNNKRVKSGPDLTKQLIGILRTRVHWWEILNLCSTKYTIFLKFLCWKDGDVDTKTVDYEMFRHVFGGLWSSSCSNYTLKKTTVNNEPAFGNELLTPLKELLCEWYALVSSKCTWSSIIGQKYLEIAWY